LIEKDVNMATKLQKQSIRNIGVYGIIRQASADDSLIPDGAIPEAINFEFDRIGVARTRPGMTAIGASVSAGNPCIGIHNIQSNTAIVAFVSSGSTTVFERQTSSWAAIAAGTGAGIFRFLDFANRTIFFGPVERSIRVYAGSNFDTSSGNPINPQQLWYVNGNINTGYIRPKFGKVYKSRIYLTGDPTNEFRSRLWFSSVITSSGNITWAPSTDFVDINPNDGEDITSLERYSLELLVFKPNYIYRFRTSGVDTDPLVKIGTRSQESIIEGKKGLYFHHDTGFYKYTGGYPVEISRPISDVVKAIPFGEYAVIRAWKDDDHIYWSIGDLTLSGPKANETWANAVIRYTESSEIWTVYSYANDIRRGGPFITSSSSSIMIGLDNGVVAEFNRGQTDLSEPIKYRLITKWYEWEGIETRKIINLLMVISEKGLGMNIMYQVNDYEDWQVLTPDLRKLISFFNTNIKFNRIRFRISGVTTNESSVFMGLEVLKGINEGIIKT